MLTAENLITILGDPQQRSRLQKAIQQEQGRYLPLHNRYAELAHKCTATPEQLHSLVKSLLAFKHRYDDLLRWLVFHPKMLDQTLFLVLAKGRCITQLGHRPGPQHLLESIAVKYHHDEAITTLALSYYATPDYPTETFAAFVREYADNSMLRGNLLRTTNLPPDKWRVVQEVFASEERNKKSLRSMS